KMPLKQYDLFILDVMMGGISGFKLADKLRNDFKLSTPIIFLTAKTGENNLLTGFNVGGDDYIEKPYSIREVIARIKALFKRNAPMLEEIIQIRDLEFHLSKKMVLIEGNPVDLTRKEFDILAILLKNKGRFISREDIMNKVWSDDVVVTERNVDVNIARLRKKIGTYGSCIKGRTGYGYIFEE
ncbi:MAG: response regulator transcription factor, partial [Prolixibacteraceae bacterium]|nr:response regulator transcription factor [Prolixibacteraceae bacterium]